MESMLIAIILLTGALELPYLLKTRRIGELAAVALILAITFTYTLDLKYKWDLPTLKTLSDILFIPVTKVLNSLFV